ncbi:WD40-repeat-containing domain protein [Coniochaeta sp. 2T2.1]|nr:WD40-repeat-containing domain protein [Coniochaeta sp. 2T2.1]
MPALHHTHPKSLEGTAKNDIVVPTPDLSDTIQALRWSPVSNHLAVAAWDGKTRIYEVSKTDGETRGVAVINAGGPLLSCDWSRDGSLVATAGAVGKIYVLQASSGQTVPFAAHNSPIRDVRFDGSVSYCDLRNTSQPVNRIVFNGQIYSMDARGRVLAVATDQNKVKLIDLTAPTIVRHDDESPFKYQIRSLAVGIGGTGLLIGSLDGRANATGLDPKPGALTKQPKPITWQCHRNPRTTTSNPVITDIYSVNAVAVHPTVKGCVATAGGDGSYRFWNVERSTHNRSYLDVVSPITACAFDCTGLWFAYAVGYDWPKGCYHNEASIPTRLVLHRVSKDDAK